MTNNNIESAIIIFKLYMGQAQCCQAQSVPSHLMNPNIVLKLLKVQQDPTQSPQSQPTYITSRTTNRKKLGDTDQGQFIDARPNLFPQVKERLRKLQPIDGQCYRRLKNERGVAEPDSFFKFFRTSIVYQGEWYKSKPHGFGKNYYPNGGYFEGTFFNGLPHGFGRFINPNGDYYQGQVRFGRGNGEGTYCSNTTVFHGLFKDNVLHGEGEQKGQSYYFKGQYEYGTKKEGLLKYEGNVYKGSFQNDNFEGKGQLVTFQGRYEGLFHNGLQHGYGQFFWKNGSKYRGNYRRGLKDGDGQYFNAENNSICRGIWKKGVLQGDGEYVEPRGNKSRVIWQQGKISAIR